MQGQSGPGTQHPTLQSTLGFPLLPPWLSPTPFTPHFPSAERTLKSFSSSLPVGCVQIVKVSGPLELLRRSPFLQYNHSNGFFLQILAVVAPRLRPPFPSWLIDQSSFPSISIWFRSMTKTVMKKWLNLKNSEFHSDCIASRDDEEEELLRQR
nr:unnamed protein product [Digitaria exilis]